MSQIGQRAKGGLPFGYSSEPGMEAAPERKRRVCCFCEQWESGGIESFLNNVLVHMDLSLLEIDIVAARLEESVFTEPLKARGIRFYQLSGILRSPKNGRAFSKLLEERNYDVVYLSIFQGLAFYYGRLAEEAGVPMRIAHSHGAGLRNSPGKNLKLCLHRFGKKLWSPSITDFWACSSHAAEFLFPKGQSYEWIPNGIDISRFRFQAAGRAAARRALGLTGDKLLVGTVGRLSEEKNHGFLLEMFHELKKRRQDSVLLLVGTGRLEEQLRTRARELDVEEDVIFYGASSNVETQLWAMDLFVFPSHVEGLGIAGVEAQAAGLPVLCSEAVPPEALVTEQAVQLELSAGAKAWAEAALSMKAADRGSGVEAVSAAGFDAGAVAEKVKTEWMRRSN